MSQICLHNLRAVTVRLSLPNDTCVVPSRDTTHATRGPLLLPTGPELLETGRASSNQGR